jgi:hypothetical protein
VLITRPRLSAKGEKYKRRKNRRRENEEESHEERNEEYWNSCTQYLCYFSSNEIIIGS